MEPNRSGTWRLKVLSVIMAVLLWLFVNNQNNIFSQKTVPSVRLNIINLGSGLTATYPNDVRVTLVGTPKTDREIYAYVDLKGKSFGTHYLPVRVKPMIGTRVSSVQPEQVQVTISQIKEFVFKVGNRIQKEPPDNYSLTTLQIEPEKCIVRGSQRQVNRVQSLVVDLDLADVKDTASLRLPVIALDRDGNPVSEGISVIPAKVQAYAVVDKAQEMARVRVQPVVSGEPASGNTINKISVEPEQITLIGPPGKMEGITEIKTATVDASGKSASFEDDVSLAAPDGMQVFPPKVKVMVELKNDAVTQGANSQ